MIRKLSWTAIVILPLALFVAGCEKENTISGPGETVPTIDALDLTPSMDAGSPVVLAVSGEGDKLSIAYTSSFAGSGDIWRLIIHDSDGDGYFDSIPVFDYYPFPGNTETVFTMPDAQQFSFIGAYEILPDGWVDPIPGYHGQVYVAGPRQLCLASFDAGDRLFYSMGYSGISQIASTQAPTDPLGAITNSYDKSLAEVFNSGGGREPEWDYWYTKKLIPAWPEDYFSFSGGYYASVSPEVDGDRWLAYADTLFTSYDHDYDGEVNEDPPGEIEVLEGGVSDGMPGIADIDDDEDGFTDLEDIEVSAMSEVAPADSSFAWQMQNYIPANDDDEDGLMDEDWVDSIDNDGDGEVDEDTAGDENGDGWPGFAGFDDDGDGQYDFWDSDVQHAEARAAYFGENGYNPVNDDDEDGLSDEDGDIHRDGLWVVKLGEDGLPDESSEPVSLTDDGGRQPFFNPVDGMDLLYVLDGEIYRLALTYNDNSVAVDGEAVNLTGSTILEAYPAYADDAASIVYAASPYGSSDIWTMNYDGSGAEAVTDYPGQELFPRFVPGGNQILFEAWLVPDGARRVMITQP